MVDQWITEHDIDGLYLTIDLGCTVKKVLRFYHTSTECYDGNTTWLTSKIHQLIIRIYNLLDSDYEGKLI
jgi:hypothetical protein